MYVRIYRLLPVSLYWDLPYVSVSNSLQHHRDLSQQHTLVVYTYATEKQCKIAR